MESIFTKNEIGLLANSISKWLTLSVRVNKCGNLDVKDKRTDGTLHFVFYKRGNNDYFVRRRTGFGQGMFQTGSPMNGGRHFKSMKEMVDYFVGYAEKKEERLYTAKQSKWLAM